MMRSMVRLREPYGIRLKKWYLLRWIGVRTYSPEEDAPSTIPATGCSPGKAIMFLPFGPSNIFLLAPSLIQSHAVEEEDSRVKVRSLRGNSQASTSDATGVCFKNKETASSRSRMGEAYMLLLLAVHTDRISKFTRNHEEKIFY